jgi:TRAP-type transport system small permease protein
MRLSGDARLVRKPHVWEERATRALELLIVVCLGLIGVLILSNVVLRYFFASGLASTEELARLLFVWLIFLGAVLATRQQAHMAFDSVVRLLSAPWQKAAAIICHLLVLVACVMLIWGGWLQVGINLNNSYPVLGISYAWLHSSALVLGLGVGLATLLNLRDACMRTQE